MNCFVTISRGIKHDYASYLNASRNPLKPLLKLHFYCNIIFRLSHFFYQIKLLPIAKVLWGFNRIVFSIDIDPGAKLLGGFELIHGVGIVIGRYVIADGSFKIFHGATLGGKNEKSAVFNGQSISQPYLQDGVIVGINAVVLGPVVIGTNANIAANATVTKNVGANCIIIGHNQILNS